MDNKEKNKKSPITTGIVITSDNEQKTGKVSNDIPVDVQRVIVLEQKAEDLDNKAREIEKSLVRSEKRQDKALNFMMGIASVIIVAFFLAIIPLLFDYYKDNERRYENFTRKIDNLSTRMDSFEKFCK